MMRAAESRWKSAPSRAGLGVCGGRGADVVVVVFVAEWAVRRADSRSGGERNRVGSGVAVVRTSFACDEKGVFVR